MPRKNAQFGNNHQKKNLDKNKNIMVKKGGKRRALTRAPSSLFQNTTNPLYSRHLYYKAASKKAPLKMDSRSVARRAAYMPKKMRLPSSALSSAHLRRIRGAQKAAKTRKRMAAYKTKYPDASAGTRRKLMKASDEFRLPGVVGRF